MAFWGTEVKPGKPFTHRFDDSKGRLHVSMASLGLGSATMKSVLQCNVGNKSPVFLCSLYPEKSESLQLNLEFEEVDEVMFSVIGPRSIHLSGYYLAGGRFRTLNDESESYGEDIADSESQRSDRSDEDEYDDSFINDDEPEVFPPSPASNSGEESWDDKKPQNGKGNRKGRLRKAYQVSESEEEDCSQPKNNANGSSVVPDLASEDEDNCLFSTYFKNGMNSKKGIHNGKNSGKAMDETPKKKTKDIGNDNCRQSDLPKEEYGDNNNVTPKKKRKERSESVKVRGEKTQQGEAKVDSNTENQQMPKITEDSELAHKSDERPKKKKKGESKNEKKFFDVDSSNLTNDVKESKEKQDEEKGEQNEPKEEKESEEKKVKKRKKKKIEKALENGEADDTEAPRLPLENNTNVVSKKTDIETSQIRTLQNGLVVEELQSGKPDGNVAVSGKKISVSYVCKLKNTGQVVDSNKDDDLFKFRLGARKVIEGWEIGLEGMRVGEKRRLTVPPLMGYGSEGDGKNIPRDSWLVYEVELVKVR